MSDPDTHEVSEAELLAAYRPWLRTVARRMMPPGGERNIEDLAQEGWVAMWKALSTHDGSAPLDYFLKYVAQRRMVSVLEKWRNADQGRRQGWSGQVDLQIAGHPTLIEDHTAIWNMLTVDLPEVEAAYHHGEILAALAELTPRQREYVLLRFWGGYNQPDIAEHFGYVPRGLWASARKKLATALEHLASV
jgi:RNA polymerase sigma factor (sigma-70 family)